MMCINNYLTKLQETDMGKYSPWIGFDLDGTLAYYVHGYAGKDKIGPPISSMIEILKDWLSKGYEVRILTARAAEKAQIPPIKQWLKENNLPDLKITNIKDPGMLILYDDRAVQVEKNTGRILGDPSIIDIH